MPYLQFLTGFTDFQIYPLSDFHVTQSLNCCACSYILLVGENSFTVKVRSWLKRKKCQKFGHIIMSLFSQSKHCTFLTQAEQVGYLKCLLPLGCSQRWNSITGTFVQL